MIKLGEREPPNRTTPVPKRGNLLFFVLDHLNLLVLVFGFAFLVAAYDGGGWDDADSILMCQTQEQSIRTIANFARKSVVSVVYALQNWGCVH